MVPFYPFHPPPTLLSSFLRITSTSFLCDPVCIRPIYTLSLFTSSPPFRTRGIHAGHQPPIPFMNIFTTVHAVYIRCILHLFSGLQFYLFSPISSAPVSRPHGLPPPANLSHCSPFSRHISISSFTLYRIFTVYVSERIVHPIYSFHLHPCTNVYFPSMGSEAVIINSIPLSSFHVVSVV